MRRAFGATRRRRTCIRVDALERGEQPCIVMAGTGEVITYAEYEARTNRLAHLLRSHGLRRGDHYAILMENHPRYLETAAPATLRAVLHADQLAPYRRRNCLHPSEQRVAGPDHLGGASRCGDSGDGRSPEREARARGRPRRSRRRLKDYGEATRPSRRRDRRRVARRPDATPRARADVGKASSVRDLLTPAEAASEPNFLIDQWQYQPGMVPLTRAALPQRSPGCDRAHDPHGWHRDCDGTFRSRTAVGIDRALSGYTHPDGADNVQPAAQAAR